MLCGVVSNRPAALYHPLPYDRSSAPSKKDSGTLEGMTHNYSAPARYGAVRQASGSGHLRRHQPCATIPATAPPCPMLWNTRRRDTTTTATVPRMASCQRRPRILTRTALERATSTPPPQSRSWGRKGHTVTPHQKQDSPGQPSTLWHCTPCLYT
jgi:hypothetical protein